VFIKQLSTNLRKIMLSKFEFFNPTDQMYREPSDLQAYGGWHFKKKLQRGKLLGTRPFFPGNWRALPRETKKLQSP
jgi:hypothetical protein